MADGSAVETAAVEAERGRGRVVLFVLAAVQFTNIVDFMIVMPLGPQLMRTLAINPTQFGWIVASYTFSASAAGVFASLLVDRFDRRNAFLILYAGFLIGTLCCALAPGYHTLLAARVLTGGFGGVIGGLAMAIVGDVFPEHRRGAAMGTLMSAFAVASVVGVPLGLVLGNRFGWHAPFFMLVGLGLVVLASGVAVLPSLREHLTSGPVKAPLREVAATLVVPNHLWAFALIVTLMLGAFAVVPYISPYLVANVKVSEANLPLVYIAGGVLSLVSSPVIGKLADRHGKYAVYRVVAPIAAALMLGVTQLPQVPLAVAVGMVAALMMGNSGRMVVAMTMVTSCVEPRRRGSFMSLNSSLQHLASGLGASLGGQIVGRAADGRLTHYGTVGWVAAIATLASIALAARLQVYTPDGVEPSTGQNDSGLGVDPAPSASLEASPFAEMI